MQDEFDDEDIDVKEVADGKYEICGKMRTDEFCDFFGVDISDEDVNTISGYFIKKLGKLACTNDKIEDEFFKYCVTEMDSSRIVKLSIEKIQK